MEILFKTGKMEILLPSKDTNYKKSKYLFKNDKENHRVFKKENGSPFFLKETNAFTNEKIGNTFSNVKNGNTFASRKFQILFRNTFFLREKSKYLEEGS